MVDSAAVFPKDDWYLGTRKSARRKKSTSLRHDVAHDSAYVYTICEAASTINQSTKVLITCSLVSSHQYRPAMSQGPDDGS
jgi:hypothetical protein